MIYMSIIVLLGVHFYTLKLGHPTSVSVRDYDMTNINTIGRSYGILILVIPFWCWDLNQNLQSESKKYIDTKIN